MSQHRITAHFKQSLAAVALVVDDEETLQTVQSIAKEIIGAVRAGNKILLAGNGGSAADAQHLAAELVGRYKLERFAWPAVALTTDTSVLTAISNDYGFEQVFARQVQGLGRRGDVFWAFSTSGTSPNIVAALKVATQLGLSTVGFTGARGGAADKGIGAFCDRLFVAPSDDTPVVQQIHMMVGHAICDEIEYALREWMPGA